MAHLVPSKFYIGIAFVFAPSEIMLAGVGEEVCAGDGKEGTEDVVGSRQ
jgi:hypothetical protein